ncbi:MAG: chromosomal replication initiator protein DnaA [Firmicutes bacterium]|nr:chromosomal replication initiator protein DnaA [Bacillota bacterium]
MTDSGETLWADIVSILGKKLDPISMQTWFSTTSVHSFNGTKLVLQVPSNEAAEHMARTFHDEIARAASFLQPHPIEIAFTAEIRARGVKLSAEEEVETPEIRFNSKYTFDTFVIGDGNRLAHAASLAIAEKPAAEYNPFFLYGGVGLGKTHLMHAIGQRALAINPELRVFYITCETFVREYVSAVMTNSLEDFQRRYRHVDILLIDDIQFISGKDGTQEEFFHTFNELYSERKQIVITSDRPPRDIPVLAERLRSRFAGGLIYDIKPPEFETRVAILRKKARAEGLDIPEEALYLIASRVETNVRELEGALIRVMAFSSMMNRDINEDLTEEALQGLLSNGAKRRLTATDVQKAVCAHYHVKLEDLLGRSRQKDISYPRQIAMYLARDITGLSLPKIGVEFGNRDHTTVLHAYDKVTREMQTDTQLALTLKRLRDDLLADYT